MEELGTDVAAWRGLLNAIVYALRTAGPNAPKRGGASTTLTRALPSLASLDAAAFDRERKVFERAVQGRFDKMRYNYAYTAVLASAEDASKEHCGLPTLSNQTSWFEERFNQVIASIFVWEHRVEQVVGGFFHSKLRAVFEGIDTSKSTRKTTVRLLVQAVMGATIRGGEGNDGVFAETAIKIRDTLVDAKTSPMPLDLAQRAADRAHGACTLAMSIIDGHAFDVLDPRSARDVSGRSLSDFTKPAEGCRPPAPPTTLLPLLNAMRVASGIKRGIAPRLGTTTFSVSLARSSILVEQGEEIAAELVNWLEDTFLPWASAKMKTSTGQLRDELWQQIAAVKSKDALVQPQLPPLGSPWPAQSRQQTFEKVTTKYSKWYDPKVPGVNSRTPAALPDGTTPHDHGSPTARGGDDQVRWVNSAKDLQPLPTKRGGAPRLPDIADHRDEVLDILYREECKKDWAGADPIEVAVTRDDTLRRHTNDAVNNTITIGIDPGLTFPVAVSARCFDRLERAVQANLVTSARALDGDLRNGQDEIKRSRNAMLKRFKWNLSTSNSPDTILESRPSGEDDGSSEHRAGGIDGNKAVERVDASDTSHPTPTLALEEDEDDDTDDETDDEDDEDYDDYDDEDEEHTDDDNDDDEDSPDGAWDEERRGDDDDKVEDLDDLSRLYRLVFAGDRIRLARNHRTTVRAEKAKHRLIDQIFDVTGINIIGMSRLSLDGVVCEYEITYNDIRSPVDRLAVVFVGKGSNSGKISATNRTNMICRALVEKVRVLRAQGVRIVIYEVDEYLTSSVCDKPTCRDEDGKRTRLVKTGRRVNQKRNNLRVYMCPRCKLPVHRDLIAARNIAFVGWHIVVWGYHPFRNYDDSDTSNGKGKGKETGVEGEGEKGEQGKDAIAGPKAAATRDEGSHAQAEEVEQTPVEGHRQEPEEPGMWIDEEE
ncbi:BZ3500_MvSof-1268-A1-R1_Chr3-1g05936 [Microbotryum saponariae]|uniref:BZ3500_MvSof-1268-A1-R1_Chr3-1g05936 protein n=1 Tax=Microbotryum saponariae TaxID=289078 RepID=A0A2X0NHN5_9BASI|nr:BZ3500_MvSof-1268-A1-R1_Chr3-1g05936 [Microbotryum saponariae]SDA05126.1 BZ3501_MvSof-1269-A2-R1_Chr3-1g05606 [Microbotryum saponariae]